MRKFEDPKIETADDFFDNLGYYTEDNQGRQWEHPIVCSGTWKEVVNQGKTEDGIYDYLRDTNDEVQDMPEEAARNLIHYAMEAWTAATNYEWAIRRAIKAHNAGHIDEAMRYLSEAGAWEDDYGAHPATSMVADLVGYEQSMDCHWRLLVALDVTEEDGSNSLLCLDCSEEASGHKLYWGDDTNHASLRCAKCGAEIEGLTPFKQA